MTTEALRHVNETLIGGFTSLMYSAAGANRNALNINVKMDDVLRYMKATNNGQVGMENSIREQTALGYKFYDEFVGLKNAMINPQDGPGQSTGEYRALKELQNNLFGPNFSQTHIGANFYDLVRGYQWDVSSIKDSTHDLNSTLNNFYWNTAQDLRNNSIETNRNIKAIAEALNNGGTGGGDGTGGTGNGNEGSGIDYTKMPGSAQNPLHVAGSEYTSQLCRDGAHCFFDLETINKQFQERKDQLKNIHDGIKDDMVDMFQYSLSGSAAVPKCFDMFSMFGRSYSVCPEVEGYWEMIAAIMMFIFYFLALMIVAKR
ncbi:TPA: hypothetical protein F3L08_04025 [Aeromonas hydrophila]|nr:hypothetical protein [Aeromonas hydrophila]HAU4973953.1 hypothetical protein [Aeromonas hydrophila]HAU4982854.1 hypothetical protein [Aeromonas hydrophila]